MEEKKGAGDMPRCLIIAVSMCFFAGTLAISSAVVLVAMIVWRIANGRVLTVTGDTTMANDFKSGAQHRHSGDYVALRRNDAFVFMRYRLL